MLFVKDFSCCRSELKPAPFIQTNQLSTPNATIEEPSPCWHVARVTPANSGWRGVPFCTRCVCGCGNFPSGRSSALPLAGRCKRCRSLPCLKAGLFSMRRQYLCQTNNTLTPTRLSCCQLYSASWGNPPEIQCVPLNFPWDASRKYTLVISQE